VSRLWDKDGKSRQVQLFDVPSVPIKRHIKIKGDANPYDPAWEIYFEKRLGLKMAENLKGRRQLLYLWQEQNGICPVCNQKITKLTGWHNHHIIWRVNGGSDKAKNRVLLQASGTRRDINPCRRRTQCIEMREEAEATATLNTPLRVIISESPWHFRQTLVWNSRLT